MILELFGELQEGKTSRLDKLRELDSKISEYSIPLVRKREEDDPVEQLGEQMAETELKEEKQPQIDDDGFMMVTKVDKKRE